MKDPLALSSGKGFIIKLPYFHGTFNFQSYPYLFFYTQVTIICGCRQELCPFYGKTGIIRKVLRVGQRVISEHS